MFLLGRFNGLNFLDKWRGKKIMFVGDSLSLNMWESLACMIHASVPNAKTSFLKKESLSTVVFQVCFSFPFPFFFNLLSLSLSLGAFFHFFFFFNFRLWFLLMLVPDATTIKFLIFSYHSFNETLLRNTSSHWCGS